LLEQPASAAPNKHLRPAAIPYIAAARRYGTIPNTSGLRPPVLKRCLARRKTLRSIT
jgi:hypothetical protein